jgi:hypothetical protein
VGHKETLRGAAVVEGDLVSSEPFPAGTDLRLSRTIAHGMAGSSGSGTKGMLNRGRAFRA